MLILAILAFSVAATTVHALPFQSGNLVTSNTLTIAGSSTVGPIAQEEIGSFPSYWNTLVTANPTWGTYSNLEK